jgi:hypothetical protein
MDEFEKNKRIVAERKKLNELKRKMQAQEKLKFNIAKKIRTTMIGALASFEDGFGYLWGIDLDDVEMTEDELKFRDLWEEIRAEILDKGNKQIHAAEDEISGYNLEWNGYIIDFIKKEN